MAADIIARGMASRVRGIHVPHPVKSGDFVTNAIGAAATVVVGTADAVLLVPFEPMRDVTISEISIDVTVLSAGNVKLGLYSLDDALLAASGDLSTGTIGVKTWAIARRFARDTRLWLGVHFSATPTIRAISAQAAAPIGYDRAAGAQQAARILTGQAYAGGMPASVAAATRATVAAQLPPLFSLTVA